MPIYETGGYRMPRAVKKFQAVDGPELVGKEVVFTEGKAVSNKRSRFSTVTAGGRPPSRRPGGRRADATLTVATPDRTDR